MVNIISIESDKIYQLPKNKILCDYNSFVPTIYNFITSDFKTDQSISNSSALSSRFQKKSALRSTKSLFKKKKKFYKINPDTRISNDGLKISFGTADSTRGNESCTKPQEPKNYLRETKSFSFTIFLGFHMNTTASGINRQ